MIKDKHFARWLFYGVCSIIILASTFSNAVQSAELAGSSLRISGFGTLGLTNTDAPDGWGFRRHIEQPANEGSLRADIDSRIGVQLNYSITPQFELVSQLVAKRRSSYAPSSDIIEWAFAAYRPVPDLTIRVGRLNIDSFLLADYRNVGFAYRYARPPVEFYGSLPTTLDGVDINKDLQFDDSRWRIKVFAGRSYAGDLAFDSRIVVSPVYGLTTTRESGGLTLRAGLSWVGLSENPNVLKPLIAALEGIQAIPVPSVVAQAHELQDLMDGEDDHSLYMAIGVNYEIQDWVMNMEVTNVTGHPSGNLRAGYAGIGRRIGPYTIFAGISHITTPDIPIETPDWATPLTPILGSAGAFQAQILAASAAIARNNYGAKQTSYSLGTRWDFRSDMALKVQWEHFKIEANGARLWANSTLEPGGRADVTSLLLDFVF